MKKSFFLLILLLGSVAAQAQVYLTDKYKPQEEKASYYSSTEEFSHDFCHSLRVKGGMRFIYQDWGGKVQTYKINKEYSTLTFWVGPDYEGGKGILVIEADGEPIYDEPLHHYYAPRLVKLDIKGVETLVFKVVDLDMNILLAHIQLWKENETVIPDSIGIEPPSRKTQLVEEVLPYYLGTEIIKKVEYHLGDNYYYDRHIDSISMDRHLFQSGLQITSRQGLFNSIEDFAYFWLNKKYEKISFVIGPRDNISSHATSWFVIKGDKDKILYEEIISQTDLPRQVVVDVSGQDRICFCTELRGSDTFGGIVFGVVDIWAYTKNDLADVPKEGLVNPNKEKMAALPSPCPLISKIPSFSYHGKAHPDAVIFDGKSRHLTFSMGGEKFNQGLIFTTGSNLWNDNIDCYFMFDLGGEFDYLSFYAGMLTKQRALADDSIRIYADGKLILDTIIHCAWPNQYFEIPINKCRKLTFAKPGNGTLNKDCYICLGDLAVYRGKPVKHHLFTHDRPECPEEADLIDLCGKPYFHYVGRYLSNITNFDFEDCFMDGSTKRRSFHMKDGTQIYKGVMLEANKPPFFEDATLMDVAMIGLMGAGSSLMSSDVAAYTGVTAGASPVALVALPLMTQSGGQASVASFNTYGEYQTCTFTIANKSEYWDAMDELLHLGDRKDEPFILNVLADQRIVKQIELRNRMEPQTFTVPLYNSSSLTFWMEPRDVRSGQFVLYDMTVSKQPYTPAKQCWEVTYEQSGAMQTIYGWLTEQEVLENIAEMRADPSVSNISYRPASANDRHACEQLFDNH
ncbi:MAG: NPCBM/NEW2 domain-containing protein [Paludibacteraceae bacterium]|nr:NPCBM/NEW2 domain-containing protein [Paludibacteraceae bacterium]